MLKKRHDLVPNLVEVVKGYAGHEKGTLSRVTEARTKAMSAEGPADKAREEKPMPASSRCKNNSWRSRTGSSTPAGITTRSSGTTTP
jgi:hypothetical protein